MVITSLLSVLAFVLFVYMNGWFLVSLVRKRNDVADIAWGFGFVLLAWMSWLLVDRVTLVGTVTVVLVTVWGLRLAIHIALRNKNRTEDPRYRQWRDAWGKWFYLRSYLQVFCLQGVLLFLIALPVFIIQADTERQFNLLASIGILVWMIGFIFEAVGDWQLTRFLKRPGNKGKLMMSGLWAYTRHPNYFGEVTQWWGIWLIALPASFGAFTIIGPVTITVLILFVSGVPMLERSMQKHPDFASYQQRVSLFFPLPPRRV